MSKKPTEKSAKKSILAGVVGIEPTPKVLETFVLPLNYTPKNFSFYFCFNNFNFHLLVRAN